MPEGDTVFRAAEAMHRVLAGRIVTRFESVLHALARLDEDHPIAGRTIESVTARGKHLLVNFSGDLALGPDLLSASFDREGALRRLRQHGGDSIADTLLDQRVLAGIGNVFKSELLFLAGIQPFTPISNLTDAALTTIIDIALKQLRMNVAERSRTLAPTRGRRTTASLHPSGGLWVYERGGRPCRKCGTTIQAKKTGLDARLTYWCRGCQSGMHPRGFVSRARDVIEV